MQLAPAVGMVPHTTRRKALTSPQVTHLAKRDGGAAVALDNGAELRGLALDLRELGAELRGL